MVTPFGRFVRDKRVEQETSLRKMAQAIGLSSAYLSAIETGRKKITDQNVESIAAFLRLDQAEFNHARWLAILSQPSCKIDLRTANDEQRQLAMNVARNLNKLSHDQLNQINSWFGED